jgi:hypothetical protein
VAAPPASLAPWLADVAGQVLDVDEETMGDIAAPEQAWLRATAAALAALAATPVQALDLTHGAAVYLGRHRLVHLVRLARSRRWTGRGSGRG